jgi:hypothetical protein
MEALKHFGIRQSFDNVRLLQHPTNGVNNLPQALPTLRSLHRNGPRNLLFERVLRFRATFF